ncbi:ThiF family adenylyltransferase [Mechercharimyces sp. CAU 1602]|uniref:ThiF family adenylyltransferase n=1 Tax=Mechercharimyces sp. CAU 1602 TaxID=2973933 RepID=UPI002161A4BD|nr:ThiF family adenylyltransferase [Mechercharimyces sp. CAU 1602]MCS1352130.1 ThiF family adenylyltransferase [Mechercharimyces sp. CAU 1602]
MSLQDRYSRQTLFPSIGFDGQAKLQAARVTIVGLGALGSASANHLVRAGVGHVHLIDRDFVEHSNLQRQMLYDEQDAHQRLPKAIAARNKLSAINSDVRLTADVIDLTWQNSEQLLQNADLIIDGSDNFTVRYLLNDISVKHKIPWIYGGAVSAHGSYFFIRPGITPCLTCLFPQPPEAGAGETCDTAGVIGPIIHVIASYQVTEALKWLVGDINSLDNRYHHFDLWSNHHSSFSVQAKRNPICPTCVKHQYHHLQPNDTSADFVSLCGRNSIQFTPAKRPSLSLTEIATKLAPVARLEQNAFLLRADFGEHQLVIFPDGRILIQGTDDPALARSFISKYIGY